jgi:MFS family permease
VQHRFRGNLRFWWIGQSPQRADDKQETDRIHEEGPCHPQRLDYKACRNWSNSAVVMGAIMMAGAIPRALLMLMGGAVSDRMSARKIMMATATARTICVTVIGVLVWLRILRTWELYVLAVAFGVADAFAVPAQAAYLPSLVNRQQLIAASSVSQSTGQLRFPADTFAMTYINLEMASSPRKSSRRRGGVPLGIWAGKIGESRSSDFNVLGELWQ